MDTTGLAGGPYGERLIEILASLHPEVEITRTAYDALDPVDEDVLYIINEAL